MNKIQKFKQIFPRSHKFLEDKVNEVVKAYKTEKNANKKQIYKEKHAKLSSQLGSISTYALILQDGFQKAFKDKNFLAGLILKEPIHNFKLTEKFSQYLLNNEKMIPYIQKDASVLLQKMMEDQNVQEVVLYKTVMQKNEANISFNFKLLEVKDDILLSSSIFDYTAMLEVKKAKKHSSKVVKDILDEILENNKEDFKDFKAQILGIEKKSDELDYATDIYYGILEDEEDPYNCKEVLSFRYLKDYDSFNLNIGLKYMIANVKNDLIEVLLNEVSDNMTKEDIEEIIKNDYKEILSIITKASNQIFVKTSTMLKEIIADDFLYFISEIPSVKEVPAFINKAIHGTRKYNPLFQTGSGDLFVKKIDQIHIRLLEADKLMNKALSDIEADQEELQKRINGMKKNIAAIKRAEGLGLNYVEKYDPKELWNIYGNDNEEYNEVKRIIQFIPSGAATMYMVEQIEKAKGMARTDFQKEDVVKAVKYYNNLHVNNTPSSLTMKSDEYKEKIKSAARRTEDIEQKIEELEEAGFDSFDENIKKLKTLLIKNLGRKRT